MSTPGFAEIIVILLVALIVFGPRKLPEVGRSMGKAVREFRRATSSLRAELEQDVDDEAASGHGDGPTTPTDDPPRAPAPADERRGDGPD